MAAGIYPPKKHPDYEPTTNIGGKKVMSMLDLFSEREWMEIEFCRVYAEEYDHGTDGHLIRKLVAKLADLLEEYYPDEDAEDE